MFASRLPLAEAYVEALATAGIERGLLGPREVPRLWDRHVLNCAVVTDLIADGQTVADLGSGAGLPGLVLAIRRPDVEVTLVEPLLRRTSFLQEVVADLALDNVVIRRGRADDVAGDLRVDVVTSRALAPLPRLLEWSMPLLGVTGQILAIKGRSAAAEVASLGLPVEAQRHLEVLEIGHDDLVVPTTVVRVDRGLGIHIRWDRSRDGAHHRHPGGSKHRRRQ